MDLFAWLAAVGWMIAGAGVGFGVRAALRSLARGTVRGRGKNMNARDRWLRALAGVVVFMITVATTWNPIMFMLAGFCFFQAAFSWCGWYAAIGKSTCPR